MASRFSTFIDTVSDPRISLLRDRNVVKWIYGDLSFLPAHKKEEEDTWGRQFTTKRQWSGHFGERLCKEVLMLRGENVIKPEKLDTFRLDLETDTHMIEVKTQTYLTKGTASEKIMGVPFKYADVSYMSGKGLRVVCIAGAEVFSKNIGLLKSPTQTLHKQKYIKFFKENDVEFIGLTELLEALPPSNLVP
uniref:Uncharacterized protein n=1 Tax=Mantoniella tinhauana virus 1 TaxID=3111543 RepID=A0AB38ZM18_9VIRU